MNRGVDPCAPRNILAKACTPYRGGSNVTFRRRNGQALEPRTGGCSSDYTSLTDFLWLAITTDGFPLSPSKSLCIISFGL